MAYDVLLQRILEARLLLGWSERRACQKAKVGLKTVYSLKLGHAPKPKNLVALAVALRVEPSYFLDVAGVEAERNSPIALSRVHVTGEVQAGVWVETVQWERDRWYDVTIPDDGRFPDIVRFGIRVRGDSMDRLYPDGTIVIAVSFGDLGRSPMSGERVVVQQRCATGEYEATLKEYEIDAAGRHILWPRSTNPEFQQPIILASPDQIALTDEMLPAGEPGLIISALVVGSYRPE